MKAPPVTSLCPCRAFVSLCVEVSCAAEAFARDSVLSEDVSNLVYQSLVAEVFLFDLGELFEELALLARQSGRRHDRDRDVEVAAAPSAERGHSLSLHAEDRAGLSARRDFQTLLAFERRHVYLRAERGLREGDGN